MRPGWAAAVLVAAVPLMSDRVTLAGETVKATILPLWRAVVGYAMLLLRTSSAVVSVKMIGQLPVAGQVGLLSGVAVAPSSRIAASVGAAANASAAANAAPAARRNRFMRAFNTTRRSKSRRASDRPTSELLPVARQNQAGTREAPV